MNNIVKLVLGAFVLMAEVAAARDPLGTIMPYDLDYGGSVEALAKRLEDVRCRSGISRFVLYAPKHVVRLSGCKSLEDYADYGRRIAQLKSILKPKGIDCGYLSMPTMNHGLNHPGGPYVKEDGSERRFTGCPLDPEFRAKLAGSLAAVARESRPFVILMEDDYTYFGSGCFCQRHLEAFAGKTGVRRDREKLRSDLRGESAVGLRVDWHRLQHDALVSLAKEISEAVAAVSPETRIGVCASGGYPEPDIVDFAVALAGKHRPWIRAWGCFYGPDYPIDFCGVLAPAQWSFENLQGKAELVYEADQVPHNVFYSSAARSQALISAACAMGSDGPYFWGLGMEEDALARSPDYLDAYRSQFDRIAEIRRCGHVGRPVGLQVVYDPYVMLKSRAQYRQWKRPGWYAPLNRLGFPVTTLDSPVKLVSGARLVETLSDESLQKLLSGSVMLDGAAAEAVIARGSGDLLGLSRIARKGVDFSEERGDFSGWTSGHMSCAFHQNYGLDGARVSAFAAAGAEVVSHYGLAGSSEHDRVSLSRFANRLGGRVAVMALNVEDVRSPNLFCFAKREMLAAVFSWLGGDEAVPVRVIDRANAMVQARASEEEGLFVHMTNVSCDPFSSYEFDVAGRWRGGKVEILDGSAWRPADATWRGRSLHLTSCVPVPVYGTLVFRIR